MQDDVINECPVYNSYIDALAYFGDDLKKCKDCPNYNYEDGIVTCKYINDHNK